MNPRQDSVLHLGLAKSYSWVWNERKHNLVEWLKGGGDLFRIKGKTGSGKSTLMKYLLTHQNTQKYLNMYQGNSKVCAYFFHELSELATQQESSITGLLHSILSQLLELFPPFADTILPLYQKYKSLHGDNVAWPVNLLKGALNQMSHETSVTGNLCLFIDGFDECRGNRHEHLEFLIEWTRLMAKTSLKVKICLASCDLPELASLNANLVLHQWTKPGITDFVKKELTGAMQHTISMDLKDHGIVISKLVQKVVNKADGVFVWAKLVVEDLVLGLKAGEDEAALEHRLSNLPQHLKDLYAHMISKIPDANLHIAFKYFQLLLRAPGDTCTMNFLQFLMASQIPEKAIDSSQPFPERYFLPHNSEPAILEKLGVMREHLKEICGNLIQIQPRRHASYRWQATRRENVTFIHLSFKDYIKDDDVKIDLEKRMSPRNVHPADKLLMASCLRLLKTQRCYVPYWVKRRKEVYQPTEETHPSQKLVSISHEVDRSPWPPPNESYQSDKNSVTNSVTESSANDNENIDDDDDEFLEELNLRTPDNTITMFFNYAHNLESESILGEAQTSYIDNLDATLRDMDARWASSFFDHRTRNYIPGIDVLCLAVCWKLHLYVEGKLNERKLRSHNIRAHKPPLLYYAMNPPGWAHEPVDMDMLSILLAAGEHPGETLYNEEEETIETMWDHIVRHYLRIGSAYPLDGWQDVLRLMLKYEANPVQLILQRDGGSASIMHLLIDQYENQYEKATQNEKDNTLYFFIFLLSSKKYADGLCSLQNSGGLNCYDYAESISSDIIKKSYTQHFSATPKLLQAPGDIDDSSSATPESRPRRRKLINKDSATLPKRHKKS
ncbi:hypothetical protein BJ878DRAFT_333472 [Calycina marina]|uniref:Nephrocystin 3-like N-terminal domain-containing protein n=1 Tax=Calycina marina TaxID=1763456 RepID=A0A9P8CG30_9HELO|nr:hypothetical protein BJ878DRAFT_333472 [Calycina marina]